MSTDRFDEIKARAEAATAGPWGWFGNTDNRDVYLATVHGGRWLVLDFAPWGEQSAQPRFRQDSVMVDGDQLVRYAVAPEATSRQDPAVYRADISGFRNGDAEFIAHSRDDADWLIREVEELRAEIERLHDAAANALVDQTQLKSMSVEDGAAQLEIHPPRELMIAWVMAAREMLGDAPNYAETPVEVPAVSMELAAAGEPERLLLTVQRVGKITPHQARLNAEQERDQLRDEVQQQRSAIAELRELVDNLRGDNDHEEPRNA